MWLNSVASIQPPEETQIATEEEGQGLADANRNVHSEGPDKAVHSADEGLHSPTL